MNALLAKFWGWIVAAGAVIAAGLGIYFKGKNEGKEDSKRKELEADVKAEQRRNATNKVANEIQNETNSLPDDDVTKRLRDKYSRD